MIPNGTKTIKNYREFENEQYESYGYDDEGPFFYDDNYDDDYDDDCNCTLPHIQTFWSLLKLMIRKIFR